MKTEEKTAKCISLLASDRNKTQQQAHGKKKRPLRILECYTRSPGIGWDHGSKWPRAALLWGHSECAGNAVQASCEEVVYKTCSHILEHTDLQPRSTSYQKLFAVFTLRGSGVFLENCFTLWPEAHAWFCRHSIQETYFCRAFPKEQSRHL